MVSSDEESKRKHPRPVSPPYIKRKKKRIDHANATQSQPTPSSVEAGKAVIEDHLAFYTKHISSSLRSAFTKISVTDWQDLYRRNQHAGGHHFVIHQHDHPVAGIHYDLRLQINEISSCSWAITYGLPGDPNSQRLNRNATETRIHCLWNHLIESASLKTGSLLLWDTGEYEILPSTIDDLLADEELTDGDQESETAADTRSEPQKLTTAFARGKIRVRLHGHKLPKDYVLYIRRPKDAKLKDRPPSVKRRGRSQGIVQQGDSNRADRSHSDDEEDKEVRRNNAYPGASNTIGSVHQRTWYASMDRPSSGFRKTTQQGETIWIRDGVQGFEPFYVKGRELERSLVSGRLTKDIMDDEGVVGYVPRAGWRAILD